MKLQKLTDGSISRVRVITPVSDNELNERKDDYLNLSKNKFSKKYNNLTYNPVELTFDNKNYNIQVNFCINPFCRWYGLDQFKYQDMHKKPSRYKIVGSHIKTISCNDIQDSVNDKPVILNYATLYSNWSLADEIKRLVDINTVIPIEPQYSFHRTDCLRHESTPFNTPNDFRSRGRSSSNSLKMQCKSCNKITNILPSQKECFTYHQKRNDILPLFMELIVSRTPVTSICKILKIGRGTYYNKLEWLYRKCLEFNERYETNKLTNLHIEELWLNTDKFTYYLNNIRRKGYDRKLIPVKDTPLFPTHIVATCDLESRYVFRADVAFDYSTTTKNVLDDYIKYQEDKLHSYLQKTDKYKAPNTTGTTFENGMTQFHMGLKAKESYVEGIHVNSGYTTMAQLWLIKELLNVDRINIITDEDSSQISSIMRIYKDMITDKKAHVFSCRVNKELTRGEAYTQYKTHRKSVAYWRKAKGIKSYEDAAIDSLASSIVNYDIYNTVNINGREYVIGSKDAIPHPLPYKDEGDRFIRCLTDLSDLTYPEIAAMIYKVDLRGINTFFNQVRRKVSILERPLVGGRSEGKSYIYSNFNPKYAQYMVTIVRTYLNFCEAYKYKGESITPAMRLGITNKVFTIRDIIYFK